VVHEKFAALLHERLQIWVDGIGAADVRRRFALLQVSIKIER